MKRFFSKGIFFLAVTLVFTQCKKDEDVQGKGNVNFEITDAPIDNTNIEGAFVTVTAVKVDGEAISSFSGKQTIDLMAYQNGNTKALGLAELEAGTYSNVTLVLDYETDANGNSPGCYVLTMDNVKHSLQATSNTTGEIVISTGNFIVEESSTTNVVLDFDVRKAIKEEDAPTNNDQYDFVTAAELNSSVRMAAKSKCGEVNGNVNDVSGVGGDRVVIFAYKKGSFNQNTETQGQGSSSIMFKNAVTSAVADANGNYTLAFLEEGEYELHYVGYEDTNNDGQMEAKGMLQVSILSSLDILGFDIDAAADVNVNVSVTGVDPF